MPRAVTRRYDDPLDAIWIRCAERIGLRVVRDPEAFASTDGRGTLRIATGEQLDADDSLAQMILHELCHSLIEGPGSFELRDWGLDNTDASSESSLGGRHELREHACLRLQALLTRPRGIAGLLAPTTDFRDVWDSLGPDPLEPASDPSTLLARRGASRVSTPPWAPHLEEALDATAAVASAVRPYAVDAPPSFRTGSLWGALEAPSERHRAGPFVAARGTIASSETCGSCGWLSEPGERASSEPRRRKSARCVKTRRAVLPELAACERWEPALRCERCGACCREGFDAVQAGAREPIVRKHRHLLVAREGGFEVPRPGGRCLALDGDGAGEAYRCRVYGDRPRSCRDFEVGGASCLLARRRVGLSW